MTTQSLMEWVSLFNEEAENVWLCERKELRNVVTLMYVLDREFEKILQSRNNKIGALKEQLYKDDPKQFPINNRGNEELKPQLDLKNSISSSLCNSTQNIDFSLLSNENDTTFNKNIDETNINDVENSIYNKSVSPVLRKNTYLAFKYRKFNSPKSQSLLNYSSELDKVQRNVNRSPMDICDISIIDSTPRPHVSKKWKESKRFNRKTKKQNVSINKPQNTLTQLISGLQDSKMNIDSCKTDFDETCLDVIEDMNKNSSDQQYLLKDVTNKENSPKSVSPKKEIITSSFAANYDKPPFYDSPKSKFVYKEDVVRGKARQELPGWDCPDCKQFYENIGLNSNEIKHYKDKCSRHRSKFKPMDNTPAGFWDLTVKFTQE